MTKFADYQRKMWLWFSYITVCRFYIERDKQGKYVIKKSGRIRTFMYYFLWANTTVKITYLLLTYNGWLLKVGFLDQMAMWDLFLCFSQLVQETNIWYRKYPLFEVLHANWKVQEEVFRKLGSPESLEKRILKSDKQLVKLHTTIVLFGCGALAIQFFQSPKYAMNTYAVFPFDNWLFRICFAAHEVTFIFHIWVHQAGSIVLCEVFSVTYTNIIHGMSETMKSLSKGGTIMSIGSEDDMEIHSNEALTDSASIHRKGIKRNRFIPDRMLDVNETARGTEYTILGLLQDYKNVMMASREFNSWTGKRMAGTMASNYGQFVSDVFMMIQLLKEPDTDPLAVFFFFEDACAGMVMLFRMLILMSRVFPASEEFLNEYKTYMQHHTPIRKYLVKYNKTLRVVATKIGGYSTKPSTVPTGINILFNYYICAAMWQRPVDRRT